MLVEGDREDLKKYNLVSKASRVLCDPQRKKIMIMEEVLEKVEK